MSPQQPGLRAFIVYSELPEGCFAIEAANSDQRDHVRRGEFAVIDPTDTEPCEGELFAIQWNGSYPDQLPPLALVEIRYNEKWGGWLACVTRHVMALDGRNVGEAMCWADGPYQAEHLRTKLRGKVIGILEPDFRPMLAGVA